MGERVLSLIIVGILQGSVYGLLAMGLSLQYGVCRVLNITHGEFVMLGAVLTYILSTGLGLNPLLAPVILGPLLFGIGFLLQATLFRALKTRAPSLAAFEGNALLAAFGVLYIIEYVARISFGSTLMPSYYLSDRVSFLGIDFILNQFVTFGIALALGVVVFIFMKR
jgi:branched-chain amino acid transport system permease protein